MESLDFFDFLYDPVVRKQHIVQYPIVGAFVMINRELPSIAN